MVRLENALLVTVFGEHAVSATPSNSAKTRRYSLEGLKTFNSRVIKNSFEFKGFVFIRRKAERIVGKCFDGKDKFIFI